MKKTNLITLSAGVLALSAVAYAAVPAIEKVQNMDPTKITHLDGDKYRSPQREMSLPYEITPTQEQFDECTIFNQNNDSEKWTFSNNTFQYKYHSTNAADDWIIMPMVHMPVGAYKISLQYKTKNYYEDFKIAIGTENNPAAMTQTIIEVSDKTNEALVDASNEFTVTTEGDYYVGMYCYSAANMYYLNVSNIKIEKIDAQRPMAPTITSIDFTGTEGSISFQMPETNLAGETLPTTPMQLYVSIDDEPVQNSPFTTSAGATKSVDLNLPNGMHTVSAYVEMQINGENKQSQNVSESFRVTKIMQIPMPLPATILPDEDEFSACTVIDCNNDNSTWKYASEGWTDQSKGITGAFRYNYNSSKAADDWLILPAIQRGSAKILNMSFDILTKYDIEAYEVFVAAEPTIEAFQAGQKIFDDESLKTSDIWEHREQKFKYEASDVFYVGIHAKSGVYKSYIYLANITVSEIDGSMPVPPVFSELTFNGGDGTVNVQVPSMCFDDTNLTASSVDINLSIDGVSYATASGAPGTIVSIPVTGLASGSHHLSTYASYVKDGKTLTSDSVDTTIIVIAPAGYTWNLPIDLDLKGASALDNFVVVDLNQDGKTWATSNDGIKYTYNGQLPADDWAILTIPVSFDDASKEYQISVVASSNNTYEENFSVCIGTTPNLDALNTTILDVQELKSSSPVELTNNFTVPAAGEYFIGIHCTSPKDRMSLIIPSLKINVAPSPEGPSLAEELTATPDETGALSATVSFKMPTLNREGNALAADQQLTATVTSSVDSKTVTGTPGQTVSTVINTVSGNNNITVTVSNEAGSGEPATVAVRCGLDTPKAPVIKSTSYSEDGLGVILTWDPVTEGINGGVTNPSAMMYRVSEWDEEDQDWYAVDHISTTSYEYRVSPNSPQQFYKLCVEAYNSPSTNSARTQIEVAAGQPYELDVIENFTNNEAIYNPLYSLNGGGATIYWGMSDPNNYSSDAALPDGQQVLVGRTGYGSGQSALMLPLVATTGSGEVEFTIDVFSGVTTPTITVFAQTYGTERMLVGELTAQAEPGWATYTFTLPEEMNNRPWIQMCVYSEFGTSSEYTMIKGYTLTSKMDVGVTDLLAGNVSVLASAGNIAINGAEGKNIVVSNLAGQVIYSAQGASNGIVIPAAAGVHIVKVDNKTFKVMVK